VAVGIVAIVTDAEVALGLLGLVAAAAAAAAAWHQTRDYATLAEAYSVTAHELSLIKERLATAHADADWGAFVQGAEQAISREHKLWLARRSRPIRVIARDPS
jgi:hypothetical protein